MAVQKYHEDTVEDTEDYSDLFDQQDEKDDEDEGNKQMWQERLARVLDEYLATIMMPGKPHGQQSYEERREGKEMNILREDGTI